MSTTSSSFGRACEVLGGAAVGAGVAKAQNREMSACRAGCSWYRPRPSWEGVPSWARCRVRSSGSPQRGAQRHERCRRRRIAPLDERKRIGRLVVRRAVKASVGRPDLGSHRSEPCSRSVGAPASAGRAERCSMATRSTATHRSSPRPPWARLSELCGTKWQQSVMASRRRLVRGAATVARGAASASQRGGLSAWPRGARPPREPSASFFAQTSTRARRALLLHRDAPLTFSVKRTQGEATI